MSWRTLDGLRRISCLLVLPAALALVSCGGAADGDGVTGPSAVTVSDMSDSSAPSDVVSASGKKSKKSKVLICHKGKDKRVPQSAVAGHLRHGDSLGSCSDVDTAVCPCFSTQSILDTASGSCNPPNTGGFCDVGPAVSYLVTTCAETTVIASYFSESAGGSCTGSDGVTVGGLDEAQYQACQAAIIGTGLCGS